MLDFRLISGPGMTHRFPTIRAAAMCIAFALAIGCLAGDTPTPSDRDQTEVPDLATRRLVPASDVIVGRTVSDEHVFVLTDMQRLITIDPFRQTAVRRQLSGVAIEDTVWGLARLDSGTMWTLIGTGALGEISPEGRIVQQIPFREPQIGLFEWKNRLIYQAFESVADTPVLMRGPPGSDMLEPFGSLRVRHFDTTRVEMVALNFVVCGVGRGDELPCWFRSEATIDRVRVGETSRPLRFETLSISEPTVGPTTAAARPRPIWDAYITESDDVWLLSTTGPFLEPDPNVHEGKYLFRYSSHGAMVGQARLAQPARLILTIRDNAAYLLTTDGGIAVVHMP